MGMAVIQIASLFQCGVFVPYIDVPSYWRWFEYTSLFTHASRAVLIEVMRHLSFTCTLSTAHCVGPLGEAFACDEQPLISYEINATFSSACQVSGRTVLHVLQGVESDSQAKWQYVLYLAIICAVFRVLSLFLLVCHMSFLKQWAHRFLRDTGAFRVFRRTRVRDVIAVQGRQVLRRATLHLSHSISRRINVRPAVSDSSSYKGVGLGRIVSSSVTWRRMSVVMKDDGSKVIDSVSGMARTGRVLAIMGPSGSGKTTMLRALSGRACFATVTGDVRFCGRALKVTDMVFVPKDIKLNSYLTVLEQLLLVGFMRCVDVVSMKKRVIKLLTVIGLHKKINVSCSQLSEGEIKCLGVAMGMVIDPHVLFLDEPTSGIDSCTSQALINHLCRFARDTSVAVIMTIHQPSSSVFHMLQDLFLLESGRLAYFGPVSDARRFFHALGHYCPDGMNPADFYMDLIYHPPTDVADITWKDLYLSFNFSAIMTAKDGTEIVHENAGIPRISIRLKSLLFFFYKSYIRDSSLVLYRTVFLVLIAVMNGTMNLSLRRETNQVRRYAGLLFINICTTVLSVVFSVESLASHQKFARDAVLNGITTYELYLVTQMLASSTRYIPMSILAETPLYWLARVNDRGDVFVYGCLISLGHMMLSEAVMLVIVEVVRDAVLSLICAIFVVGSVLLLSGFFIRVVDMPIWFRWLSYIVPTKVRHLLCFFCFC